MKVRLTDKFVAAVTAPAATRLEVFDQHPQGAGLMLRVTSKGQKTWMVRYRTDDGQQRRFSLGLYPDVTLTDARDRAAEARKAARDGNDPAAAKKRKRAEAKAQPLKHYADLAETYLTACETGEWMPRRKRKRASTLAGERWLWKRHIKPDLGDLRIEDVTAGVIKKLLRALLAKGLGVTSNRVRALIRQTFNFAIAEGRIAANPVANIKPLGAEKPRERVISDDEMRVIWAALDDTSKLRKPVAKGQPEGPKVYVSEPVRIAIKLLALTLTRRAEVAGMSRDELNLDLGLWTIPGVRTKNGLTHLVPLAPQAVDLIREAIRLADEGREHDHPLVFPSPIDREGPKEPRHISPAALSHALRDIRIALGLKRLSPHDLRRTAATNLASERLGVTPFLIGRLLNHTSETGGAAMVTVSTYARHDFASEKRAALRAWATLLQSIVTGEKLPDNVTNIRTVA